MLPASLPYTSIAAVLQITNEMPLVMVITIINAVSLLHTGQNTKIKGDDAIAMISVGALAVGYLLMNIFSTSSNLSGDVCSTLFGSTLDKSAEKIVRTVKATGAIVSGPIPLPTHKRIFTVNRSTFVNKKSREQFELS